MFCSDFVIGSEVHSDLRSEIITRSVFFLCSVVCLLFMKAIPRDQTGEEREKKEREKERERERSM